MIFVLLCGIHSSFIRIEDCITSKYNSDGPPDNALLIHESTQNSLNVYLWSMYVSEVRSWSVTSNLRSVYPACPPFLFVIAGWHSLLRKTAVVMYEFTSRSVIIRVSCVHVHDCYRPLLLVQLSASFVLDVIVVLIMIVLVFFLEASSPFISYMSGSSFCTHTYGVLEFRGHVNVYPPVPTHAVAVGNIYWAIRFAQSPSSDNTCGHHDISVLFNTSPHFRICVSRALPPLDAVSDDGWCFTRILRPCRPPICLHYHHFHTPHLVVGWSYIHTVRMYSCRVSTRSWIWA